MKRGYRICLSSKIVDSRAIATMHFNRRDDALINNNKTLKCPIPNSPTPPAPRIIMYASEGGNTD